MKINPISNPNIMRKFQSTQPITSARKAAGKRDEVTFSQEALDFSKALAEARDALELRTPEERARIAEITEEVRNGEYRVSSDKIADKILESVLGRR